ncbi:hypothetical protein HW555_014054, partial [Spodoptera exigua]
MALLGYGDDENSAQWLCGGTVISERFILTAAHCISTKALGNVSYAALGLLKRTDPKELWNIHKIKRIIPHPEYSAPSKYHDIALLETETEINFGKNLLPACLDTGTNKENTAEASGWGRLGHRKSLADTLQVKFDDATCANHFPPHRHLKHGYDSEKQSCYGNNGDIIDTCEGDSGGPLQTNQFKCQYTVVGVTSYGKNCGIPGSAGMYTRVSYYVPWIESIVWPEETDERKKQDNLWLDKLRIIWPQILEFWYEPCVTNGVNGTCVGVFRYPSASLTYLYANAGFAREKYNYPELTDICSYKDKEPVVCCTDCKIPDTERYRHTAIGNLATLTDTTGPVAWSKCLEYFQRLPYPCRHQGNFELKKIWKEDKRCHEYKINIALVVGGRSAQRWEFPHMDFTGDDEKSESTQWLCGGTVISERFILTAAHCIYTKALGSVSYAALGLLKRTDPKELWNIHKIKRIIPHPEYSAPSKYHDIALLETETEIKFAKNLLPACLDVGKSNSRTAEASGWGRLGHKMNLADALQVVDLRQFEDKECADLFPPHRHLKNGYNHEKKMCYGNHKEIFDTCEGDSGGPLQTNQFKCQYTVVGVTSYGKNCGIPGSAGMYTRVSYYVPWIESIIDNKYSPDNVIKSVSNKQSSSLAVERAGKMAATKNMFLFFLLTFLCCVNCQLGLDEGSPCVTTGLKGVCVNVFKCNSAALTYLYANAGFDLKEYKIPALPEICSYKDNEPVVCCTDCDVECFEYFQKLPYGCRFPGYFTIDKTWLHNSQCHNHTFRTGGVGFAVGGRDAKRWEFPHVALLGYGDDVDSAQWLCGGSVISERFILTAAHCSSTRLLGSIQYAALGLLRRTDPKENWKIYKIKRIINHPEYKPPSKYNDIALLETENEIAFGQDLLPACLHTGADYIRFAEASGWGRLGHRQALADTLQ